ncbi:MAG: hypothetical protein HGA83_06325 [Bacteroidales bacterium]|nr:hypothetical protein [Bacteroidales bacterium]NTV19026.1 hypothetical protein [Bacteroidales bacterium]
MKRRYGIALWSLVVVGYFFLYGFYGINDADDGFTLALSWRMFNGEVPYRDFILVRPPLSPLLHVITLYLVPENLQIIFERFLFYVMMGFSSLFGAYTIQHAFRKDLEWYVDPYLLASVGFVYSVGSFSPMPWHTVDGIFFASAGAYLITRSLSPGFIMAGTILLTLSALCKQSFYLIPAAGILFISLVSKDWKKAVLSVLTFLAMLCAYIYLLYRFGALGGFLDLTTGSTKISDLLFAGLLNYVGLSSVYYLLLIVLVVFFKRVEQNTGYKNIGKYLPYIFITILLLYPLILFAYKVFYKGDAGVFVFFSDKVAIVLFVISILLSLDLFEMEKKWLVFGFLVFISWSSGISWGNPSPVLFSLPLLYSFFIASKYYFDVENLNGFAVYMFCLGFVVYFMAYQKPYCNPVRSEISYSVSDVFPKLSYIRVDKKTYEKYHEFASLVDRYGHNFKILPGMPASHYLAGAKSPVALDWVFNGEINDRSDDVLYMIAKKKVVVFMEKQPQLIEMKNSSERFNSLVAYTVRNTWYMVDSTKYFQVFTFRD